MKKGDYVQTPRFLTVRISEVLTEDEAITEGFTEPTHYEGVNYEIRGKSIDLNRMVFAAIKKTD
jgi:hypothetical protein